MLIRGLVSQIVMTTGCAALCSNAIKCEYTPPSYDTVVGWMQPMYDTLKTAVLSVGQELQTKYKMAELPIMILGGGSALDAGLREVSY